MVPDQSEIVRTAQRYDAIPYVSIPDRAHHPARLCAVARLYGLEPVLPSRSRVLEIGCASGGHLIPLAAAFPEALFTGIDISPVQIAGAQFRAARHGLENIEFTVKSFTDLQPRDGMFDYIICHGVYSWVSEELSEKLLQACGMCLAPGGIAAVSYNVLPGWRMLQALRDSALFHTASAPSHEVRMAAARHLFSTISEHADQGRAYGHMWREIADQFLQLPDAYHAHDLFGDPNRPVTFTGFARAASGHGLAHLADADFKANFPEAAGEAAGSAIRELSGGGNYAAEQYLDIMTGRTFRRSLLVHERTALAADRSLPDGRIDTIYLGAPEEATLSQVAGTDSWRFGSQKHRFITIHDMATVDALQRLLQRRPAFRNLASLLPVSQPDAGFHQHLRNSFMELLRQGMLDLSAEPLPCAHAVPEFPKIWRLALKDARDGLERTATQLHSVYHMSSQARLLLSLADGSRSREALAGALFERLASGSATVALAGNPVTDEETLLEIAQTTVDRELAAYLSAGLLLEDQG